MTDNTIKDIISDFKIILEKKKVSRNTEIQTNYFNVLFLENEILVVKEKAISVTQTTEDELKENLKSEGIDPELVLEISKKLKI